MEEYGDSVVLKASKASGICLDRLYDVIEAFGGGIGDAVLQIGDDVFKVLFDHLGDPLDGFKFTTACPAIPLFEELPCAGGIPAVPEVFEGFFDGMRTSDFQSQRPQFVKSSLHLFAEIFKARQPKIFALLQCGIFPTGEGLVFLPAHLINCLIEVLADMESAMHDVRIGQVGFGGFDIVTPHIHSDRFYFL